jgi:hypothetical protein
VTRTSARSNFSVIPARASGARGRIPLGTWERTGILRAGQPRARMTEQEIEQDRNCHYDLQSSRRLPKAPSPAEPALRAFGPKGCCLCSTSFRRSVGRLAAGALDGPSAHPTREKMGYAEHARRANRLLPRMRIFIAEGHNCLCVTSFQRSLAQWLHNRATASF